ncbi:hypothetical protein [Methanopyrus sp. KOL6]|uniref:hypothetical protein n=1 Tax=Methanopyrus sp. KOL6 TaxID=1937004 RepID=UPI0012F80E1C|nr:hypothetical protein [Methanopyrus sp. KOL6]
MVGTKQIKAIAAGVIATLALVNSYAASIPRYQIAEGKVIYPYFDRHDLLRTLKYPSVLGPAVDTYLPTRTVVNCRQIMLYGLKRVGVISIGAPVTMLPTLNYDNLTRSSDNPIVTYYGISSNPICLSFPCIDAVEIEKDLLLIPTRNSLVVAKGRGEVIKGIGVVLVQGNWNIICMLPENAYSGVFTWKSELRPFWLL